MVRVPVDFIRAWEHPYDYVCGHRASTCGCLIRAWEYPYDQSYRAVWGPMGSARPHPPSPARWSTGILPPHNRRKTVYENCTCSTFSHGKHGSKHLRNKHAGLHDTRVLTVSALMGPRTTQELHVT